MINILNKASESTNYVEQSCGTHLVIDHRRVHIMVRVNLLNQLTMKQFVGQETAVGLDRLRPPKRGAAGAICPRTSGSKGPHN